MSMAVVRAVVVDRTPHGGVRQGDGKATRRLACGVFAACVVAFAATAALPAAAAKRTPKPGSTQVAPTPVARPTPFSSGPLAATAPPGWAVQTLPKVQRQTFYDLVPENGTIVLRARADASASSLRHGLFVDPKAMPTLRWRWRWRTERVLQGGDMTTKEGDDYAARLYVFFDRDPETMSFKERTLLKLGRARYGDQLPAAALCYVWDNRHPVGTIMDNAYTPFVAMVVASSGDAQVGRWQTLQRDVREDYKRAFNTDPPRIIGVAVSVDTDNTGESTTTWFGDIEFVAGAKR
jgi:hypothetical protein